MGYEIKHAVVALSGGLDSAVAAALLLEQGWQVLGVHLVLTDSWPENFDLPALGRFLGIEVRRLDLRQEFQQQVIDYFIRAYQGGTTPNPCVRCNEQIKFGHLRQQARAWGYPYLATGHYARLAPTPQGGWGLYRGADPGKEQSYFLHRLAPASLANILFPLGGWTKAQVRGKAEALGLVPYILTRESQELCFIPGKYPEYLQTQGRGQGPGPIVNRSGELLGTHRGLEHYTIGQRQGLGIAAAAPYYVLALEPAGNKLVVGAKAELLATDVLVEDVNWLVPPPTAPQRVTVRLRYRHPGVSCLMRPASAGQVQVRLDRPQTAVTPGQAAVFYQDDQVLGGGWIVRGDQP